jgi:hypothetical protein
MIPGLHAGVQTHVIKIPRRKKVCVYPKDFFERQRSTPPVTSFTSGKTDTLLIFVNHKSCNV